MATLAAVDCGTNSVRLLVSNGQGRDRRVLDRRMTITRLGQGVDASGRLAPEAIGRTLDVLRGYRRVIDELGATEVTVAATAAAR
ncbi:MAG TPA: exopolyphosphatase, partial [Acidimicrobiales bacterium]|nr:exopolyphosphatase [Acidimicrobiales bacterium]